jgi:acyl-coenzyme A thioesterase 9
MRAHPPSASTCLIPLASQPEVRLHYVNKTNMTRFGKILEDLDTFAVWIAYRHNQGPDVDLGTTPNHIPFNAVTACVDKINLQNRIIRSDLDIVMSGVVTWVGRSSMEITMKLSQIYDENDYR